MQTKIRNVTTDSPLSGVSVQVDEQSVQTTGDDGIAESSSGNKVAVLGHGIFVFDSYEDLREIWIESPLTPPTPTPITMPPTPTTP